MIAFTVFGKPAPAGSKRAFRHRTTDKVMVVDANANSRPWKAQVADAAAQAMNGPGGPLFEGKLLDGPLGLEVTFYFPRPKSHYGTGYNKNTIRPGAPRYPSLRPDTTKLLRAIEDAMTGVVWRDDAQIVDQRARKLYGESARAEVSVWEFR